MCVIHTFENRIKGLTTPRELAGTPLMSEALIGVVTFPYNQ